MHSAPAFQCDDDGGAIAFIASHPFAAIVVNGNCGPVTAHVPLVLGGVDALTRAPQIMLGHVAKNNPFWRAAQDTDQPAVAIFRGADAYVSPAYYPSKHAVGPNLGKVVPTWNYITAEVRGAISVETRADFMLPYITALTDKMESRREMPWQVSDAPSAYIEKLSNAIIGFSLKIENITHVKKLSQNKSKPDRDGVMQALEASDHLLERETAAEMKKDR